MNEPAAEDATERAFCDGAIRTEDQTVLVRFGVRQWSLAEGESLVTGRQSTCDVIFGAAEPGPEDLGVSRRAATLSYAQGRLWIRNDSTTLPVLITSTTGRRYVLERRGDIVSVADASITIVFEGQITSYLLDVRLPGHPAVDDSLEPATLAPATRSALELTPRERRLLAALCEPLLDSKDLRARPASYREVADRLELSVHTVRNALDALRERLIAVGIPGMVGSTAKDNLARYAVRSGSVTPEDIETIEVPSADAPKGKG